ncbi:hypothetical protein AAFC00_003800 [Neodothiora populina]|uniref:Increased loss of mitochondrial DNA protein 1 n=1 Tax=Neodothiora populina TaxID=2781224 RepID=A0ABR3PFE8_9PEZI
MGVFSAFSVIRALSLFHITVAYFMFVSPKTVAEQNIVVIFGGAMQIPPTGAFNKPTEATALCALVLIFLSVSDLLAASLPTRSALEYWTTVTPVRLLLLFLMTAYIYLTSSSSSLADSAFGSLKSTRWPGDAIKNNLCFTMGFVESMTWFWIYNLLRDERRDFVLDEARKEAEREERERERAMFNR